MKLEYENKGHCQTLRKRFENFRRERLKMNAQQAISEVLSKYEIDLSEEESFRKFLAAVDRGMQQRAAKRKRYASEPNYEAIRQRIKSDPDYGKKKKQKAEQLSLL